MDTDDGTHVTGACFQPPDAENRTSGGVEGSRGAIPATPSDHASAFLHLEGAACGIADPKLVEWEPC
jgi:hypothetical protein